MAGGIIQLSIYGSQDIFLTGTPQITFFKIVYRRHTNFAIETKSRLIAGMDFGETIRHTIEKSGDLLSSINLEFDVPSVKITNQTDVRDNTDYDVSTVQQHLNIAKKFYFLVKSYILSNISYIRDMSSNIRNIQSLKNDLILFIQNNKDVLSYLFPNMYQSINTHISMIDASLSTINSQYYSHISDFFTTIVVLYDKLYNTYNQLVNGTPINSNIKFGWVEELGHSVIDRISIIMGNNVIDTHTGEWLTIYNKLYLTDSQLPGLYESIGNINDLISPHINPKPKKKIIVPLQFWFCRTIGTSIPLVAMKYHDIDIEITLKNIQSVLWIESQKIKPQDLNLKLENPRLLIDYIFLSNEERRRFAQSSHEYLIETLQYDQFDEKLPSSCQLHMNFIHPTKFIVWFAQPGYRRINTNGNRRPQWNNFGVNDNKTGQTMSHSYLKINSHNRTDPKLDATYYNYVQPYYHFAHSPTDGMYTYSFALHPTLHQPSSSINFSRIDDFSINIKFTDEFMQLVNEANDGYDEYGLNGNIYIGVYAISYNILRFVSGMVGLCFSSGAKE